MDTNTSYNPYSPEGANVDSRTIDQATRSADHAIESTQEMAKGLFARVANKTASARDSALPAIDKAAGQLRDAARISADTVRDKTTQVRDAALRASDVAAAYVREDPLKGMLLSAAAGAALIALASLLVRSRE